MSMPPSLISSLSPVKRDKLTPDQQQILIKAAKASEVYQQQLWRKIDADTRAQAKAMGAKLSKWIKRRSAPPCSRYSMTLKDPVQAALLAKFEAAAE